MRKVIVFDLDETIGCFQFLSIYFNILIKIKKINDLKKNEIYYTLLDNFPRVFRPKIFKLFKKIIKEKKKKNFNVFLYTNNTGSRKYVLRIIKYIHKKLNYKLFDKVISGFGTNKIKRQGCYKTYSDISKYYNNRNVEVLFFDDRHHEKMINKHSKCIILNEYSYDINFHSFIKIFKSINNKKKYLTANQLNNYFKKLNNYGLNFDILKKNKKEFKIINNEIINFIKKKSKTYKQKNIKKKKKTKKYIFF